MRGDTEQIKNLIREAQNGNREAFGLLYQKYGEEIAQFIFWRVGDKLSAEDLLQEVFLKAWSAIKRYKIGKNPFRSWLYKIARNTIIDFYRTKKTETSLEEVSIEFASYKQPIQENVELKLKKEKVLKAIHLLPEIQRDVIILKFIQELSNKEVSAILGKSETAIRIIQYRALKRLREIIKDEKI